MDKRYDEVARLQAKAWAHLKMMNPNYESKDVEKLFFWQKARKLADEIAADKK